MDFNLTSDRIILIGSMVFATNLPSFFSGFLRIAAVATATDGAVAAGIVSLFLTIPY
jgi:hypothetical protein